MRRTPLLFVGVAIFLGLASPQRALAQGDSTNATVTGGNVNLREQPPRFTPRTFIRFRLTPGAVIAVLSEGTRVEALERTVIAGKHEWFKVRWKREDGSSLTGWMYVGTDGTRRYLRLDSGIDVSSSWIVPWLPSLGLMKAAHAQPASEEATVVEPADDVDPLRTLAIGACHVAVFVVSLVVVRKWVFPDSAQLTFATSLALLLIMGFITMEVFQKAMTKFVSGV